MNERDPTKPPTDYADEYDPTGYYERKRIHREEMLPLLAWIWGAGLLIVAAVTIWEFVT